MRHYRVIVFTKTMSTVDGKWEDEQSAETTKQYALNLASLCNENPSQTLANRTIWPMSTLLVERQDGSFEIVPTREITRVVLEVKEIDSHG